MVMQNRRNYNEQMVEGLAGILKDGRCDFFFVLSELVLALGSDPCCQAALVFFVRFTAITVPRCTPNGNIGK